MSLIGLSSYYNPIGRLPMSIHSNVTSFSLKNWVESEVLDSSGSYFTIGGFKMNIYVYFNAISEELLYVCVCV